MDTIRQTDVGVVEKIKQVWGRVGLRERREAEMNNSLTGGMKKPQRVFGAVWWKCVWCVVAQQCVWVIHHTNTAGGHSLAQRYAEQGENNVLRLHPLNLIETHSTGATFTHPPHAHFINLPLACIFPQIIPKNRNRKQTYGFSIMVEGASSEFCVSTGCMLLSKAAFHQPKTLNCSDGWVNWYIRCAIKKALGCY